MPAADVHPRGTVAFLFTDIEGSTRLWQHHRPAMERAYARHDAILRGAVAGQGGVVYKVIGDAVQAAFPSAEQAVATALEAQLGLAFEDWSAIGLDQVLTVRMALHAGAVDPDPDGDYRSPVLNRLGRLLGAGHGGQVLLSQAVVQLARDRLPEETSLRDLGDHRLKDLLEPEHVHQLVHPALPGDFPPLVTLERRPHNLPVQPTLLVGREREVGEVTALLRRPDVRLLTLTGPGGTGKTRLSLQAAAELVDGFPDGVRFVPLATVTEPALVVSAIADALGVREEGGQPLPALLAGHLAGRSLLLVLDNLEQVLAAAGVVNDLLSAAPGLCVLATSRAPLRLRIEREYPVPPLGLPKRKPPPTAEQLSQYAAVRLFIERAQAVRPDFAVDAANAPAIAEICHRLDGLPLAIELAAARVRLFPPQAMLARLEQRLPLLTGGARDLPLRQQTLRAAIDWSYDLLTEDERRLYRRLSVFAGGWTIEAAEAVAGSRASGELALDVVAGLDALTEHSLVRGVEGTEDEPRFTMLETIREYGLERLEQEGEAHEARERHAAFFLALAEVSDPSSTEALPTAELGNRIGHELENFRVALRWYSQQNPDSCLRLAGALYYWWLTHWPLSEAMGWLDGALGAVDDSTPAEPLARALAADLWLAVDQGDEGRAIRRGHEALALWRSLGDTRPIARQTAFTLIGLAMAMDSAGDQTQVEEYYDEALALGRALDSTFVIEVALGNLGWRALCHGNLARARVLLEETLQLADSVRNPNGVAAALCSLGDVTRLQEDTSGAAALYRRSLAFSSSQWDPLLIVGNLHGLASVGASSDRVVEATRLGGAEDALRREAGLRREQFVEEEQRRLVAGLQSRLGGAAFDAAWAAGRALSRDEAVAEALALANELAGDGGVPAASPH